MGDKKQNIALEAKFQQDYGLVMNEFVMAGHMGLLRFFFIPRLTTLKTSRVVTQSRTRDKKNHSKPLCQAVGGTSVNHQK